MSEFGDLLAKLRATQRVSQRSLAIRAGTSQSYVSRVESGAVTPTLDQAGSLLNALGHRLELRVAALPGRVDEVERPRELAMTADERIQAAADLHNVITELQDSLHG
jgi:transcriptional regulator with XRE-family HTH domain